MKLKDKVVVITGAGSGMGRATALLFAQEGARVVVADIARQHGTETVKQIEANGGRAVFVEVDVTDEVQVAKMIQTAVEAFGRLDILFNNAGIVMPSQPVEAVTVALWDRVMAVNVRGIFLGVRAAVPIMKRQGGGVILITASIMGKRARSGYCAYATSKAAAAHLARALALELAPHSIRVNSISPVAAETPMLADFLGSGDDLESRRQAVQATIPLGRLCQPEDVAQAALYLASEEAAFLTGMDLAVDGGRGI